MSGPAPRVLPSQRHLFSMPRDLAYFNCGYMAPALKSVVERGEEGVRRKASPWTIAPEDFFTDADALRDRLATLLGAASDDIAITAAASYGIAVAAANVPVRRNQQIVILEEQFPSNYYAWRRRAQQSGAHLREVPTPADGDWTAAVLEALRDDTAVLAVPNCHWASGGLLDLEVLGAACEAQGAALVLDITQSAGALPIDLQRVRPAFAVAALYKWLLGPYSMAMLYVDPRYQDGQPLELNWITRRGAEDFQSLCDYADEFAPGARRFDVGERSNFVLLPMALAAVDQLLEWGVANVGCTLGRFNAQLGRALEAIGLRHYPRRYSAPHFLSVQLPEPVPADLVRRLADERVFVSVRGRWLRVTPHLYNDETDARRLVESLARHLQR